MATLARRAQQCQVVQRLWRHGLRLRQPRLGGEGGTQADQQGAHHMAVQVPRGGRIGQAAQALRCRHGPATVPVRPGRSAPGRRTPRRHRRGIAAAPAGRAPRPRRLGPPARRRRRARWPGRRGRPAHGPGQSSCGRPPCRPALRQAHPTGTGSGPAPASRQAGTRSGPGCAAGPRRAGSPPAAGGGMPLRSASLPWPTKKKPTIGSGAWSSRSCSACIQRGTSLCKPMMKGLAVLQQQALRRTQLEVSKAKTAGHRFLPGLRRRHSTCLPADHR